MPGFNIVVDDPSDDLDEIARSPNGTVVALGVSGDASNNFLVTINALTGVATTTPITVSPTMFNSLGNLNTFKFDSIVNAAGNLVTVDLHRDSFTQYYGSVGAITPSGTEVELTHFTNSVLAGDSAILSLTQDSSGDLFGTTLGGNIFEIAKTASGYSSTPILLGNLAAISSSGSAPLSVDAAGNLVGVTSNGGTNGGGVFFELVKTAQGYSAPSVIFNFSGSAAGTGPMGGLVADSQGNLFGTTNGGPAGHIGGSVFEIPHVGSGYATSPTMLALLQPGAVAGETGSSTRVSSSLLIDANGDLFGIAGSSLLFELTATGSGYSNAVSFINVLPQGQGSFNSVLPLVNDAQGGVYGLTYGSSAGHAALFSLSGIGFVTQGSAIPTPPSAVHHIVPDDFNGDGRSDILWRSTGAVITDWLGSGNGSFTNNAAHALNGAADSSWQVVGTGDFNGDGRSDILWRNSSGLLTEWLGNADGSFTDNSARAASRAADNSWQVVGTGDFNGDGRSDILWRNSSGFLTEWLGNADGSFTDNSAHAASGAADSSWQVVGTADFNGDGRSDILWRNSNGFLTEWLGNADGSFTDNSAHAASGAATSDWQVVGTGDFNGDGMSDILWRNWRSGFLTEWLGTSSGGFTDNGTHAATGAADSGWMVEGTGDYNGDGRSDILWRHVGGLVTEWLGNSDGSFTDNGAYALTGVADMSWNVQHLANSTIVLL